MKNLKIEIGKNELQGAKVTKFLAFLDLPSSTPYSVDGSTLHFEADLTQMEVDEKKEAFLFYVENNIKYLRKRKIKSLRSYTNLKIRSIITDDEGNPLTETKWIQFSQNLQDVKNDFIETLLKGTAEITEEEQATVKKAKEVLKKKNTYIAKHKEIKAKIQEMDIEQLKDFDIEAENWKVKVSND
tara:strand:+ start:16938 stop:17492 length:555 start_codon:yes stop_codon:yes gene_type:complete